MPFGNPDYFGGNATSPPLPFVSSQVARSHHTPPVPSVLDPTILGSQAAKHVENIDGLEQKFQINEQLLYEHEFRERCYGTAHLQRLQRGIFNDSNIHGNAIMHMI